jgi:acyl-CoA reductase-like NAD-dependent aldehyde dehydrogenase
MKHFLAYLGGQWVDGCYEPRPLVHPSTGEIFATVAECDEEQASAAVERAQEAYRSTTWTPEERKTFLLDLGMASFSMIRCIGLIEPENPRPIIERFI